MYVTGDVSREYLDRIQQARSDSAKTTRAVGGAGYDHLNAEVLTFPR